MSVSHNKKYYKIGEISKYLGVKTSVLRFWEEKFPQLKIKKNKVSGHRRYTQKDFDLIIQIHDLLYNKNFKIEGALKELSTVKTDTQEEKIVIKKDLLPDKNSIKEELLELKTLIENL